MLTLDLVDNGPKHVVLVGIVAESAKMGLGLTASVAAAIPAAVEKTLLELAMLGVTATRRDQPRDADLWWAA